MSLMTDGKAPGPVRFYLRCDRRDCEARAVFELVITEPGPDIEQDLMGHIMHESGKAVPYIAEMGWKFYPGGIGYWCPRCTGHRTGPAPAVVRDPAAPKQRARRRRPK
ncbi:hypothetical protein DF268_22635 [Streptomyces sp. V2]|uniref:Uncharacterized protein n=1 Tax=Streptomyces niveiscabiei TaxID=164115 RepID=A0ABW9I293_9ACTN|nr:MULTISPECIES: hypothetical protein [Streptomyces]PWG11286.1 hypothetical protein DF268_22635 [Streptomyces sp. V2]QZZ31056.1 hypothetical protein A7X85_36765 [Streptomyces sp. ST1015]